MIIIVSFTAPFVVVYMELSEAEKTQLLKDVITGAKDSVPYIIRAIITMAGIIFCFGISMFFMIKKDMKEGGWLYNLKNSKNDVS